MANDKPVLIAGAGPVGMTMAAELARLGVAVRIVDKSRGAYRQVEGAGGVEPHARTDRAVGLRRSFPFRRHQRARRADFQRQGTPGRYHAGRRQQPVSIGTDDPAERDRAVAGRSVWWNSASRSSGAWNLRPSPSALAGVTATLRNAAGKEETVAADWLIGCDGAHSRGAPRASGWNSPARLSRVTGCSPTRGWRG